MRKVKILFIFFLLSQFAEKANSQISVSNTNYLEQLMQTTTYYVYSIYDKDEIGLLKNAMDTIWTITPLKFITYDIYLKNYINLENPGKYSFISLDGYNKSKLSVNGEYVDETYTFMHLWMQNDDDDVIRYARVELFPDFLTREEISFLSKEGNKFAVPGFLYVEGILYNYKMGYVAKYLQVIQKFLLAEEDRKATMQVRNNKALQKLKDGTLYMSEFSFIEYSVMQQDVKKQDISKTMKDYQYKYKVLSDKALSDKILNTSQPFYYFTFIKSNNEKYISVTNSKTGELIYTSFDDYGFKLKRNDVEALYDVIKEID